MRIKTAPQYPVIDGFTLQTHLACDLQFRSLVLDEWENLRRAGAYRFKQWPVPPDPSSTVVPAWDSYEYQLQVKPGSVIWSYQFVRGELSGFFALQIVNACDDVALMSEVEMATDNTADSGQIPLSRLLVISRPGLLNVTLTNRSDSNQPGKQVILCGGEPI